MHHPFGLLPYIFIIQVLTNNAYKNEAMYMYTHRYTYIHI